MSKVKTITGLDRITKRLGVEASKSGDYIDALSAAVYQEGFEIIGVAVKRIPVDTGRARATHYVSPPDDSGVVMIGFGTDYALALHDNVEAFHDVGGPLYLKSVVDEAKRGYVRRMAARTASNHSRGIGVRSIPRIAPIAPEDKGEMWQKAQRARKAQGARKARRGKK